MWWALQRPALESFTKHPLDVGFGGELPGCGYRCRDGQKFDVFKVSGVGKPEHLLGRLDWKVRLALFLTGLKTLLEVRPLPHPGFCLFVSFPEDPLGTEKRILGEKVVMGLPGLTLTSDWNFPRTPVSSNHHALQLGRRW